jgi:hypothetical protein
MSGWVRAGGQSDADFYKAQAEKAEEQARRIPYEIERQAMLRIAQAFRALEAQARQRERG